MQVPCNFSPPPMIPQNPQSLCPFVAIPQKHKTKKEGCCKKSDLGLVLFPEKHQNSAKKKNGKKRHSLCVMKRNERTKNPSLAGRELHKPIPREPEQTTTAKAVTATPPLYEEATNNPLLQLVPLAVPPIPNQTKSLHMLNPVVPTHCTSPFSAQAPAPEG